jgi:hypothetical protein
MLLHLIDPGRQFLIIAQIVNMIIYLNKDLLHDVFRICLIVDSIRDESLELSVIVTPYNGNLQDNSPPLKIF